MPAAVAIPTFPIFPEYYYHDARRTHIEARAFASAGRISPGSGSIRVHTYATGLAYRLIGERPAMVGALAGLAVAASIALFGRTVSQSFGRRAALASAAAVALWPSGVFHTAQNLKDPWVLALFFAALAALIPILRGAGRPRHAIAALLTLAAIGLLRSYVLVAAAAALVVAAAVAAVRNRGFERGSVSAAAIGITAIILYKTSASALFAGPLRAGHEPELTKLVPSVAGESGEHVGLFTPRGITEFRSIRQANDRQIAKDHQRREIGTQLYPDAVFESWLDVAVFLPKAAFQMLFMPLPGLYPLEGKPGRIAAAAENVALLALALAAIWRLRRNRPGPAGVILLAFFAIMVCGTALLEFDLGSASRHKLLYFPMLFPFAFGAEKP